MGYRETQARKEFLEEFEAEERQKQEARERPLREAESKYQQTVNELAKIERENVAKLRDGELYVAPELVNARMSWEQAAAFNSAESRKFVEACPEYYPCDENHRQLCDYFERNNTNIISASMWQAAFQRLNSLGLMIHRPAPEPEPIREQALEPVEPAQEQPRPYTIGRDLQTGEPREYSQYEIDKMSAGEFRMIFNLRSIYGRQIDPRTREEAILGD